MKHLSTRTAILAFLAGGLFFLNSCLSDTNTGQTSVFEVGLVVENMGAYQSTANPNADSDSIRIDRVRIIFNDFYARVAQDSVIFLNQVGQVGLNVNSNNYQNPRRLVGRGVPAGVYSSFTMNIVKVPEDGGSSFDSDFTNEDGTRYSMIVEGTYNDTEFTYKSEQTINRTFNFGPLNIAEENDNNAYLISTDASRWFLGVDGYINPADNSNAEQIDANINSSLSFISLEEYNSSTQQ